MRAGIEAATMWGWWNQTAPVTTQRKDVLATAYVQHGKQASIGPCTAFFCERCAQPPTLPPDTGVSQGCTQK